MPKEQKVISMRVPVAVEVREYMVKSDENQGQWIESQALRIQHIDTEDDGSFTIYVERI